eukprot:TRINITY_DN248_c0_g1_i2.p2 TRINITY_DN248_c0_g1~~TRINITY_DN248_c0_g1_i2.p2  ORF type:complete len:201 (-),score=58.75 TRINITY_DN248_c0_g1_i2:116-718(-)
MRTRCSPACSPLDSALVAQLSAQRWKQRRRTFSFFTLLIRSLHSLNLHSFFLSVQPDMTLCPGGVCKAGVCQLRPCKEGQCCISGRNRPDGMKCEGGSCSKGECVPAPVAPAPVAVNIAPVAPVAAPAPTATPVSSPVKLVLPKLSKNASPAEIKAARRVARLLRESHSKQDKETLAIYKKIEQQVKKTEKKRAKKNLSK